jgi:hypothetical protein
METVYFQPQRINPKYCEVGVIVGEYIMYLDDPCKILLSEVKIIDEQNVVFDKKSRMYIVI